MFLVTIQTEANMQSLPSTAAQIIVTIIPLVGIIMGCTVIMLFIVYNHKQRMLMIEKGILKRGSFDIDLFSLFSGIFLLGIGLSLGIFFLLKEGLQYSVLSGLIPFSAGVSLLLFFLIRTKLNNTNNNDKSKTF